ncbi:VOC family protein [Thalassobius sp. MITS945101]|uniref:VOC family protein n=1 Tax=Thalassobius sp. MITS945101 TaxID=3096994 RepID=UPI00399BAD2D
MNVSLEHANVTVSDPHKTADWLGRVFGWKVRWEGTSINGGYTVHVGNETSYLALYTPGDDATGAVDNSYAVRGGLNHLAVVVEDLDGVEGRVKAAGFTTGNHGDYEPGRRFYFHDADGIEFEVVSYAA